MIKWDVKISFDSQAPKAHLEMSHWLKTNFEQFSTAIHKVKHSILLMFQLAKAR